MKRTSAALLIIALGVSSSPSTATSGGVGGQVQGAKGEAVNTYRVGQAGARPAWVESAFKRSLAHLIRHGNALGLVNPEAEVALFGADRDALGMTHVRLNQVFQGVPVFGGQLIVHMDADTVRELVSGRVFGSVRQVNTTPRIDAARAIEAATSALGRSGRFAKKPEARLLLLPHEVKNPRGASGATLVYQVELLINDGTSDTAHHIYFVNAEDAGIVWHYNNLQHQI